MLVHTNPIINKAAMEALRLLLIEGTPVAPAAAQAQQARTVDTQWTFREGAPALSGLTYSKTYGRLDDASLETTRFDLQALPADKRALADEWARVFSRILSRLLGVPFEAFVRVYFQSGQNTLLWVLRQASGALPGEQAFAAAADTIARLVHLTQLPASMRQAQAGELIASGVEDVDGAVDLMAKLIAMGLVMGLNPGSLLPGEERDESIAEWMQPKPATELWLRFDPLTPVADSERARAEEVARQRRHAHGIFDPSEIDPQTGRPWASTQY
jgi:hypothetical protein